MSNKMTQGFDEYWDKENVRFDDSYHKHKETYDLGAASRQAEINELNFQLAEMKSRLNDAYTDGQASMYKINKPKIDALQKRINLALSAVWNDELSHIVIDILRGESNELP